jgi:hypothetical protein
MYGDSMIDDLGSNSNLERTYGEIFEEERIVWCTPVEEKAFIHDDEVTAGELADVGSCKSQKWHMDVSAH